MSSAENSWSGPVEALFNTKYSDFTIMCQGVEFKVLRGVVGVVPYFDALCSGGFMVSNPHITNSAFANIEQEATNRVSDLSDYHPAIVSRVIYFIYTGVYSDLRIPHVFRDHCAEYTSLIVATTPEFNELVVGGASESEDYSPNAAFHQTILEINLQDFKLADMLDIPTLRQKASYNISDSYALACDSPGLAWALDILFDITRQDDDLRIRVFTYFARKHMISCDAQEAVIALFSEGDPKLWKICCGTVDVYRKLEEAFCTSQMENVVAKLNDVGLLCKHGRKILFRVPRIEEDQTWDEAWEENDGIALESDCGQCNLNGDLD
ncbi:hypothetical protein LTR84_012638 [Exophiala bonariae]|uniref:BTB domain-containing protein n=1 Tax=Exophiala bonariae TaxID=1690606 RepID=A0AAV9NEY2_9EURO|nr:hypothetical protein LTR84_012638 [Exophiala bonariae]